MTTTITGIFDSRIEAERAVTDLLTAGFTQSEISLLVSDRTRATMFNETTANNNTAHIDTNVAGAPRVSTVEAERGGLAGATVGGALGAIAAGLTAGGLLVIPGVNLLVAGPLVAAFAAGGAGATIGGIAGALLGAGFSDSDAKTSESELAAGKAVLTVTAAAARAETARAILRRDGATSTRAA